jgi:hypothetical protein
VRKIRSKTAGVGQNNSQLTAPAPISQKLRERCGGIRTMVEKSTAIEKLSHQVTDQDATFIYGESHNGPLHVGALSFFEDEITHEELIRHFEVMSARLLELSSGFMVS